MPWPDIFFKSKKPKPDSEVPPPFKPAAQAPPTPPDIQPPTIKPVPAATSTQAVPTPTPQVRIGTSATSTRTLPAMHGVILRPPARLNTTTQISPQPALPPEPMKNIEQLMAEADPVRTLSETGSVRMLKRTAPVPTPTASNAPTAPLPPMPATEPSSIKPDPALPGTAASVTSTPAPTAPPPPLSAITSERRPLPMPPPSTAAVTQAIRGPRIGDSPFLTKPSVSLTSTQTRKLGPTPPPAMIPIPLGSIMRRKANLADVARIILPPKREEPDPLPAPAEPAPTVVPPSFSVVSSPSRAVEEPQPVLGPITTPAAALENPFLEKSEPKPVALDIPTKNDAVASPEQRIDLPTLFPDPPKVDPEAHKPLPTGDVSAASEPKLDPEAHKETPVIAPAPILPPEPVAEIAAPPVTTTPPVTEPLPETLSLFTEPPKVDPEAHKTTPLDSPVTEPVPQLDPQAHKEPPQAIEPEKPEPSKELGPVKEKREFHLTNGEKVAGVVLSETPEAIYIEHGTLGVVTIPRNEIAKRLVEIILINGDRIVGDIMAETADMLYVRHASLGMLSVPRAQRSTRVVEAILTDGDRILGEILTETDTFTVIKSATLGTVTVPHNKISMLNRKIEQIQLKALPTSTPLPELTDK